MAMIRTPDTFVQEYMGKRIDDDGAYKEQCVDGFRVGCKYVDVPAVPTPNNWADGYWTCLNANGTPSASTERWQNTYFEKIRNPQDFRNGDWVIWARGSASHPSSHIAMYYNGQSFGENQGGDRGFCLKNTNFNDALGALRFKGWNKIQPYASDLTINGRLYHVYGQAEHLRTVVLSPGLNKVAKIQDLDCGYYVYAKITGCNFYQTRNDIEGQKYGTTYGPISSTISDVYQNLPNQDTTMFFDIETGEHADCTGVNINPEHNVFSPSLIYQPGKNVQYARMVGLGLCTTASNYCFLIRHKDGTYAMGGSDGQVTPDQIARDFESIMEFESIAIIDGGGSAQMMRYLPKENKVEYTRTTPQPVAGCIAFIGGPVPQTDPTPAPEPEPETPADPDEDQKDEEQTMPEEKTQEQPEKEPAEAPKKIELSGKVMSLITIMLTCALVYMVIFSIEVPDFFQKCYLLILTTFFTKGTAKAITDK